MEEQDLRCAQLAATEFAGPVPGFREQRTWEEHQTPALGA